MPDSLSFSVIRVGSCTTYRAIFMCRLSWNLGVSASGNPQGLSKPETGLLYLFLPIGRIALKSDIGDFHGNLSIKIHILVEADKNIGHFE